MSEKLDTFAPLDGNVKNFKKGLYISEAFQYEDPTYLGFSLHFDFDSAQTDAETGIMENALFAETEGLDSAINYLYNIGFVQKSQMLKQFKETVRFMNTHAPYYFQGISGVADLWKIEKKSKGFEPNRGHEKKVKIECLESVDLRITALADLYKTATFDERNMREIVPENLRWFNVTIRIAEIRNFHKLKTAAENANAISAGGDLVNITNDLISVVEFKLINCEFDFEESFADEFKMDETEAAKQSFVIKVGHIKRRSTYKLLDLVLENYYSSTAGNGIVDKSIVIGGKLGGEPQPLDRAVLAGLPDESKIPGLGSAVNKVTSIGGGAVSVIKDQVNSLGEQIAGAPGRLLAGATNNLQSRITGAALGNVYDLRNSTVLEAINGFLSGGDTISGGPLGDVYPNVPGSDTTTRTESNLGNAYG